MNLISCDGCWAVLDKNKMAFPKDIHRDDGSVDPEKAEWDGSRFAPYVRCRLCSHKILENQS